MKNLFSFYIFLYFVLSSFASYAEERNYRKTVKDYRGKSIIRITVEYLGKEPLEEFESRHDWRKKDTDFYRLIYENLTDKLIEFVKQKSYSKIPVRFYSERELPDGKIEIERSSDTVTRDFREKPIHDGNTLEPYETKIIDNNYICYTIHSYNIRYHKMTIKYDGQEYNFLIHYVYKR